MLAFVKKLLFVFVLAAVLLFGIQPENLQALSGTIQFHLKIWDIWNLYTTPAFPIALLFVVFFRYQLKARFPVFDVSLFVVNKPFTFSSLAALLNYSTTFSVTFLMSLYLQYIKGLDPKTAGTILMAQPVMMAVLSPLTGKLSDRVEPRLLATAGMVITVIGVFLFSRIGGCWKKRYGFVAEDTAFK